MTAANRDGIKIGDIFSSSWGYDQTNVDFYEVVDTTVASVKIRQIGGRYIEGQGVVAVKGSFLERSHLRRYKDNEPVTKRSNTSGGWSGTTIKVRDFAWAHKYYGAPQYDTIAAGQPGH